jgi:hypothetical protein
MQNTFKDEDKKKLVDFLNFIAEKGKFGDMQVSDVIKFYGLLSYMQKDLLPKIDAHVMEIKQVIEAENQEESESQEESNKEE